MIKKFKIIFLGILFFLFFSLFTPPVFAACPSIGVAPPTFSPTSPVSGNIMSFTAVVSQLDLLCGTTPASTALMFVADTQGVIWASSYFPTPPLGPGESVTLNWSNAWTAQAGTYQIAIVADIFNQVESDSLARSDNTGGSVFIVKAAVMADLISSFVNPTSSFNPEESISFTTKVENISQGSAGSTLTAFNIDGRECGQTVFTAAYPDGRSWTWDKTRCPLSSGSHQALVVANVCKVGIICDPKIEESNLGNNAAIFPFNITAPPPNQAPSCTLINGPDALTVNQTGSYTAQASDTDGFIASYSWHASGGNPLSGTLSNFSWSSSASGNYTIDLTVGDNQGAVGSCPTKSVTVTQTPPTIDSLKVTNAQFTSTSEFSSGTYGTSGNQVLQGGRNWFNPMSISLTGTAGSGTLTEYYVAFYYKDLGQSTTPPSCTNSFTEDICLADLKSKISDPKNGFLLRYDSTDQTYWVWNGSWIPLPAGASVSVPNDSNVLFRVSRQISPATWIVNFSSNFGSKNFYTAAYVVNSNNLSAFAGEVNVTAVP